MIQSLPIVSALLATGLPRAGDDQEKSPEAVFKSLVAALKKDDLKAIMSHLTRDSQSAVAGLMWLGAVFGKPSRLMNDTPFSPKEKEQIKAIENALKRHGLSHDALMKAFDQHKKKATAVEDEWSVLVFLGEVVKDKTTFVAEMTKVLETTEAAEGDQELGPLEIRKAKVKAVKIDGKVARSQVSFPDADGKEKSATVYFKEEGGVWKIDFIETSRNWPKPPPPPQVQPPPTPAQPPVIVCETQRRLLRCFRPCLRRW